MGLHEPNSIHDRRLVLELRDKNSLKRSARACIEAPALERAHAEGSKNTKSCGGQARALSHAATARA